MELLFSPVKPFSALISNPYASLFAVLCVTAWQASPIQLLSTVVIAASIRDPEDQELFTAKAAKATKETR